MVALGAFTVNALHLSFVADVGLVRTAESSEGCFGTTVNCHQLLGLAAVD